VELTQGRRIIVLCPEWDTPAGGVRKLYRHVDVLSGHGYPAFVSHHKPGFRCNWFANSTPVLYPPQCYPRPFDILVVPELYSWDICRQTPGVPKVVFNQNAYQSFDRITLGSQNDPAPYTREDVLATIVVSEDSRSYLNYVFPDHRLFRIRESVDPRVFLFEERKKKQIAYMPRKLPVDAAQVLGILESRGVLAGVDVVKIENMDEAGTAAVLRESLIFLSFATEEGWSLPPMEAMACGCIAVGYHGRGGREYFTDEFGFPVPADDIVLFASTVERVLKQYDSDPASLREMARRASEHVRSVYSPSAEERDILDVWEQILHFHELPPVVS
jgi:glycosyltransferase involved in cell wall biosynthesis